MGRPAEPLEARYAVEDRGYETPCWIWQRSLTRKGYGHMWDPRSQHLIEAHRYFYEIFVAPIPEEMQIDHLCRVRACVRPSHLETVTQFVNQQRGANAKLNREQADEIRRRGRLIERRPGQRREGETSLAALAREFGVTRGVVYGIVRGHQWP